MNRITTLAAIFAALVFYGARAEPSDTVSPRAVQLDDDRFVVLDVRTADEYRAGHIPGAMNVDVTDAGFSAGVSNLDRTKTYVVHCGANVPNGRAAKAMELMRDVGFEQLLSMEGGVAGWTRAGRELNVPKGE